MRHTTTKKGLMDAHPSIPEGEEAARCDALKCGGTYADFVPLIPRDASRKSMRTKTDGKTDGKRATYGKKTRDL
jgi:hypothetical protein